MSIIKHHPRTFIMRFIVAVSVCGCCMMFPIRAATLEASLDERKGANHQSSQFNVCSSEFAGSLLGGGCQEEGEEE